MVDILHRIGVKDSSADVVFDALTTLGGLSSWWASDTSGSVDVGGVIQLRFLPGGFDLKLIELTPCASVRWEVVDGPAEWIGTTVNWEIKQDGDYTIVLFSHAGWKEPVEFMNHCSTKWATFLLSLKSLLESGTGYPDPNDVQISNWH
ncbi:MAG: activator of Hsp90 ATPase 1 family protein [Microbacteriaceae bacterium]|nr:activator of Hsp90 ATPase 1 family protein [Microbacteriaceae bacterium]